MKPRSISALMLSILAIAFLGTPEIKAAPVVTIYHVVVTISPASNALSGGTKIYCDTGFAGPCDQQVWDLGAGIGLGASQRAILTQTGPIPGGGNFDTSDRYPFGLPCSTAEGSPCQVTIAIDYGSGLTTVYNSGDIGGPLVAFNNEPNSVPSGSFNEAHDWQSVPVIPAGAPFMLALGYADNEHSDPCADADQDCVPQPNFNASGADYFIGAGISNAGICSTECWDNGALLITAIAPPGKSISIGPSSMEGAIKIAAFDWVNGGYSFKTNFTGNIAITASVSITGKCIGGNQATDTLVVPLGTIVYAAVAGSDWKPTGNANSILSWQGAVMAPNTLCGGNGALLDASKGAVFNATITGAPAGGLVTFRFKFRDPAAKGKHNTNCTDGSPANAPFRDKADICGASWSATKTDP